MVQQISGTVAFFKAMAPVLIANVLTVTFVYCFAKISQLEHTRKRVASPISGCSSLSSCSCCMGCMCGALDH
jgi:hypothetical protein